MEHIINKDTLVSNSSQPYLGEKGFIALITLLSAFIPLSTDLYLPALPGMSKYFNVPVNLTNLTLILFMVFFSIGMLLWGPLSDKYGRRPILLIGLSLYIIASLSCVYSINIYHLIISRIFQALGGGAASAVATAIVKDVYNGRKREVTIALIQSMVVVSPAVAPVIGGIILKFTSWRGVFFVLAGIGFLAITGTILMKETIDHCYRGTIFQTMGRLGTLLRNQGFMSLLMVFSLSAIPFMAFIASSSYIYVDGFGLTPQVYSYYFITNAVGLMAGPMLYLYLSKRFFRRTIIIGCFAMVFMSGLLVCTIGSITPWLFTITLFPSTLAGSCMRPPSAHMMLEQLEEDAGSASSLMGCLTIFMGSIGMTFISMDWNNLILVLGIMTIITSIVCELLWIFISQKPFIKQIQEAVV
jgi:DHA1 family bicyclomycin/chloramphenicol resistance-like MFS transporter